MPELPVGPAVPGWAPVVPPEHVAVEGRWCRLEPLTPAHAPALHAAYAGDDGSIWTYMPWGPFATPADLEAVVDWIGAQPDWQGYAIVTPQGPQGMACYLRIDPANGVLEVGAIAYAPALQRTTAATEAMFLLADRAFAAGFRRYEWKCDDLNAASRSAAIRLGFTYEGTFRQAVVYKGRNRDTAWYSIVDREWPQLRSSYARWLDPANFDEGGRQRSRLGDLIREV